jgi:hypothetical protein
MSSIRLLAVMLLLVFHTGCSGPPAVSSEPGDPQAVEVLEKHWSALSRGEWQAAHNRLHPKLKAEFSLKKFTAFHAKRRKSDGFPRAIKITGSERLGDDVIVSFDALFAPAGGGEPLPVPPRRKVCVRKSEDSWGLMTHDLLAVQP